MGAKIIAIDLEDDKLKIARKDGHADSPLIPKKKIP